MLRILAGRLFLVSQAQIGRYLSLEIRYRRKSR
jgi:hypothetical protein